MSAPSESAAVAVSVLELVARDLATISRVRPEIGRLLDDVGVARNLRRALHLLDEKQTGLDGVSVPQFVTQSSSLQV